MKIQTNIFVKKSLALLMALVIIIVSMPNVLVKAEGTSEYYSTKKYVNLRTGASISASVINVLPPKTELELLDKTNEKWYKVKVISGQEGYVYASDLVQINGATPTPEPTATPKPTVSPTPTQEPSATPTPTQEPTSTPEPTVSPTPTQEPTSTPEPTATPTPEPTPEPTPTPVTTPKPSVDGNSYLKVIGAPSGLNLRAEPTTSSNILERIDNGSILINHGQTGSWYSVTTVSSNKTGYVHGDYVTNYNPDTTDNSPIQLSSTAVSLAKYQSVYLTVGTSESVIWSSSNTDVATVSNGFIYAKGTGTASITVQSISGKNSATCVITVNEPEDIRYAFSGENSASANTAFDLIAVTPVETDCVFFEVNGQTIMSNTFTTESENEAGYTNTVRLFSASVVLPQGEYTAKVYTENSNDSYTFSVFVGAGADVYTSSKRQISSSMISILENFEGYAPTVYIDHLGGGIPTVGYGLVLYSNDIFYNNLTKTEARAQLVDTLKNGGYVSSINKLVSENNLNINQAQFDSLVSFTYNIGSGWTYGSDTKTALTSIQDFSTLTDEGNTQEDAFITLMLQWHHAVGGCIPGLLFRRLGEAKVFMYGDYAQAYSSHPNYRLNVYGFKYPNCMSKYQ